MSVCLLFYITKILIIEFFVASIFPSYNLHREHWYCVCGFAKSRSFSTNFEFGIFSHFFIIFRMCVCVGVGVMNGGASHAGVDS